MNTFQFIGLIRAIYGKSLPDLDEIQAKGLLAVKIAQHYALRIDFLDEKVCRHLSRLFRSAVTVPPDDIDSLITSYTDSSWHESIRDFQKVPLASASIGQVHRAKHVDGSDIIVKVIKSNYKAAFVDDIKALRRFLRFVIMVYPKLSKVFDPQGILDHIENYTMSELDLRNEIAGAATLQKIKDEYAGRYDLSMLKLPEFYSNLSGENILVAKFIKGRTFDEMLTDGSLTYDMLLDFFRIHGLYLFAAGTFHGDVHPGNIIMDQEGKINLVDTGALSSSSERLRKGLFRFFESLCVYDYDECASRLNAMAEPGISGREFESFRLKFLDLYKDFKDSTVSTVSLTRKMMDTIKLGIHSGMRFERGMFPIIKSLMYLDGMVLRCKPDAVLIRDMKPFIEGFNKIL